MAFLENMNFKTLGYNRTKGAELEFHDLHLILDSTFKDMTCHSLIEIIEGSRPGMSNCIKKPIKMHFGCSLLMLSQFKS